MTTFEQKEKQCLEIVKSFIIDDIFNFDDAVKLEDNRFIISLGNISLMKIRADIYDTGNPDYIMCSLYFECANCTYDIIQSEVSKRLKVKTTFFKDPRESINSVTFKYFGH